MTGAAGGGGDLLKQATQAMMAREKEGGQGERGSAFSSRMARSADSRTHQAGRGGRRTHADQDNSQQEDGQPDHLDSDDPRSGVATPQPDPSDKRLPGISSYFSPQNPTSPSFGRLARSLGTAFTMDALPRCTSVDSLDFSRPVDEADAVMHPYPTPPDSQTSSVHRLKLSDASADEKSSLLSVEDGCTRPSLVKSTSATLTMKSLKRSSTTPLAVLTPDSVHAAHLSPASSEASWSPPREERANSDVLEQSIELLKKLTNDPLKSTPPTPTRARSSHTRRSEDSAGSERSPEKSTHLSPDAAHASNGVSAPKGKLFVKILEARGLRKSWDPYVVAVFQRNELVSKGPRVEEHDDADEITSNPMSRSGSDTGRPMAIPMKSRQSSNVSIVVSEPRDFRKGRRSMTNPKWDTEAVFDVTSSDARVNITVYDRSPAQEEFLGHVDLNAKLVENDHSPVRGWFPLRGKDNSAALPAGEIHVEVTFQRIEKKHHGPNDFQILKLIGKGTFGQVYQVRKKDTKRIYAMKVLSKKVIVQKKEVAHTVGERNIMVRTAMAESPFIVGLKFSFQTPTDLYLVSDYMSGGELFWHLQKEGRFDEARAKFYIAELILALQHLHMHDIVYRDLKPENILLDANGHIALCDFGLSKANLTKNATTNTFCGTTEYLAPEVLLDEAGYTKMVDFWSLGVLVFEMCCGWSPFYAEDTQQMYKNIAFGKVRFPRDTLTTEGRNFVKGLLNRNPKHRLGATDDAEELKNHPFFDDIDWDALTRKQITPPFKPKLKSETDTSNFDPEFTNALNGASSLNARAAALAAGMDTSTPLSPGMQANFKGFTFVDESAMEENLRGRNRDFDDMDEDMGDKRYFDDDDDDFLRGHAGDRMSGIVRTGDEGMFSGDHFDM